MERRYRAILAGKVASDPSQKARELSTISTVDNRLADGRGLSEAADRSRIPSLSLARSILPLPLDGSRSVSFCPPPLFVSPSPLSFSLLLFLIPTFSHPDPRHLLVAFATYRCETCATSTEGVRTRSENTEITGLRRERRRVTCTSRVCSRENSPPDDSQ